MALVSDRTADHGDSRSCSDDSSAYDAKSPGSCILGEHIYVEALKLLVSEIPVSVDLNADPKDLCFCEAGG